MFLLRKGKSNGLVVVDVASGAWYPDRGKIRDHTLVGPLLSVGRLSGHSDEEVRTMAEWFDKALDSPAEGVPTK